MANLNTPIEAIEGVNFISFFTTKEAIEMITENIDKSFKDTINTLGTYADAVLGKYPTNVEQTDSSQVKWLLKLMAFLNDCGIVNWDSVPVMFVNNKRPDETNWGANAFQLGISKLKCTITKYPVNIRIGIGSYDDLIISGDSIDMPDTTHYYGAMPDNMEHFFVILFGILDYKNFFKYNNDVH